MNERAKSILTRQATALNQTRGVVDSLSLNPDDFTLTLEDEQAIRNVVGMIETTMAEIAKLTK
jgi:hypothetical protein